MCITTSKTKAIASLSRTDRGSFIKDENKRIKVNPQPNLCALFSVSAINSRLTEDDLVAAASVTSVASSSSPAVLSMVEAARSSNTIDAVAEAFFWGEEEAMTSIPHNLSTLLNLANLRNECS